MINRKVCFSAALAALQVCRCASAAEFDCVIEPKSTVDVRAASEGVIAGIHVQRGDRIKAGQVLVELESGFERANMEVAKFRASMQGPILLRQSRFEYASTKSDRREKLAGQNFVSAQDREEALAEKRFAEADLIEAKETRRLSELEHRRALEQLKLKVIRSPFDGVVVDRMLNLGDLADNRDLRKPILRIADLSTLNVEVMLPASAYQSIKLGQEVEIKPEISAGRIKGKVKVIDQVFDAASNTVGVRVELPNPKMAIPAGVRCLASFPGVSAPNIRPTALNSRQ